MVQWDFWVNLNLTVKGRRRPQRVILEKNISGWTCILSVCTGGLRVGARRTFVVGMFDYLLIYDKQEGMLGMSRLCYHA